MTKYICPVCGYPELTEPPRLWSICPCCGTEFEYDDAQASYEELRRRWLVKGAQWWSRCDTMPDGWNAREQLEQAGFA